MLDGAVIGVLESRAAEQLGVLITRHGGHVLSAPALAEIPVIDAEDARALVARLEHEAPGAAVFQTGVGTRALLDAAANAGVGRALESILARTTVVVRGHKPQAVLRAAGIRVDRAAASPFTTEELIAALGSFDLAGKPVLVQRYGATNERLAAYLAAAGAVPIDVPTYRWALPENLEPLYRLMDALEAGSVKAVVFTSASQLRNLFCAAADRNRSHALWEGLQRTPLVSIGPVCSSALRTAGLAVAAEASPPKLGYLVEAIGRAMGATASH